MSTLSPPSIVFSRVLVVEGERLNFEIPDCWKYSVLSTLAD